MIDVASFLRRGLALAAALSVAAPLAAQDTRHVTEPVVPPACTTIAARLEYVGDSTISAVDESSPDTRRIQTAIDHCARGHAVVLAAEGARRAFLSGPIQLREGVTLVVGDGAVLLASRNPRDYDVAPGSCGVVSTKGHGCKPLILAEHASGSSVMGPGTVAAAAIGVPKYAAVVDARYTGRDGAVVDGTPTFRTLGAAISELPQGGIGRAVIFLRNGRYHEKLDIDRPYLTLLGESRDSTIITYDAAAGEPAPGGGTYGTRGSYTLRIVAPDFRAENLTIENAFDYPANAAKPESDSTKLRGSQAVALLLDMSSDRATFVNVKITGYQDTLFPNAGRAYFYRCEIWGNVDFIFGAGRAVFDDCDIVSRDRGSRTNNGYITAPSTPAAQPYGFVFVHSRLRKERPQMAPNSVALGRPWHPYGNPAVNSSAVYVDCWMDDHIGAKGWDRMSSTDSTGARTWNLPENARFFEYGSTGPGAVASPTRRLLSADEAERYDPGVVLDGWIPAH